MIKDLVSVVVPAYNVKDYIEECVVSLLYQSYEKVEIILIDDGSTDGTEDICEQFAKTNENVCLYHQVNSGVAIARKTGVSLAKGYYLCFVDADDYLESNYIENLMCHMNNFDIVTSGYYWGYNNQEKFYGEIPCGIYTSENEMAYIRENMIMYKDTLSRGVLPYIWGKVYRTDIARQVFEEINETLFWGEDTEFLYRYILKCNSIDITDVCGYHYRIREGSIVRSGNEKYLKNCNELYLSLKKVFEHHPQKEQLIVKLQKWISTMLVNATRTMGFDVSAQSVEFIFPYQNELKDKKIILYGAGNVGRNYYRQIDYYKECKLMLWVDKNYEIYREQGVAPIEAIKEQTYDFIVIAVEKGEVAREIGNDLVQRGIKKENILWKEPRRTIF